MNTIAVPLMPPALYYMENFNRPPWRGCRGKTLLTILGVCSVENRCFVCPHMVRCRTEYDYLVDTEKIIWKECERHVTRYYK